MDSASEASCAMSCHLCSPPRSVSLGCTDLMSGNHLRHVRLFHEGQYEPFKCPQCDTKSTTQLVFLAHALTQHRDTPVPKPVESPSSYLDALGELMMQLNIYSSHKHGQLATNMVQFVKDQSEVVESPTQVQDQEEVMESDDEVTEIAVVQPDMEEDDDQQLSCSFCSVKFPATAASMLRAHEDKKHNEVSNGCYQCDECPKRYHNQSTFLVHLRVHQTSGKSPKRPKGIKRPKREIKEEGIKVEVKQEEVFKRPPSPIPPGKDMVMFKLVKCHYCHKKFNGHSQLIQHQMRDHGLMRKKTDSTWKDKAKYHCSDCGFRFGGSVSLHLATFHVKKRLVQCSECTYSHSWLICNVQSHINSVHKGKAHIIDTRNTVTEELKKLAKQLLTTKDGQPVSVNRIGRRSGR